MHSPISGDCVSVGAHASPAIGTSASGQSASAGIFVSHNSARLSGIDAARGIAMLLVCLSHIRYHFEAMPEVPELSVVCFRHLPSGLDGEGLDAHQDRLQAALELSGDGWLTTTRLRGATWLRAGVLNYLATEADIDRLLDTLRELAATA